MEQKFFNRLLHLINEKPKQGKRIIGLSANALWELWQRVAEQEKLKKKEQSKRPERKRQAGGGRKKEAQILCRLLVALLLHETTLDNARISRINRLCRIDSVELYP